MSFTSILFGKQLLTSIDQEKQLYPDFFSDLNLDQIVDAITANKQEYNLVPFFLYPLSDIDTIHYRHEVMKDLQNPDLFSVVKRFSQKMREQRACLAQSNKLYYPLQKQRLFLDSVDMYCKNLAEFSRELINFKFISRGFNDFRDFLSSYTVSPYFIYLSTEIGKIYNELSQVQYSMIVKGNSIHVGKYANEENYEDMVVSTFMKFKQGSAKEYEYEFTNFLEMNHIEAKILDFVSDLFPDIFHHLKDFCEKNIEYLDLIIQRFDREIQFYISYLDFILKFEREGLRFCFPNISRSKEISDYGCFDLALANRLLTENMTIVTNDFYLKDPERIIVVTGPNQGGKTTFARTFGQLHYLSSLGCPIPGKKASMFLFDRIFTHFEKQEIVQNLRGKLQDDLIRFSEIFQVATENSIIVINEIFSSTTLSDAIFLGVEIMKKIILKDMLCVCVTFIDELTTLSNKNVSMVSTVAANNPAERTFKIVRKKADGLSYAVTIAEKYQLTYKNIKERIH